MSKKIKGPISELQHRLDYSPDFGELRMYKSIPLFVYDDFKKGHRGNEYFIGRAKYLGRGRTCTNRYRMKLFQKENVPILFDDESALSGFTVGEVYAVTPEVMLDVDQELAQGMCMKRTQRNIFLLDQESPVRSKKNFYPSLKCHVYLGIEEYWDDMATFPCPVQIDSASKRRYFIWG